MKCFKPSQGLENALHLYLLLYFEMSLSQMFPLVHPDPVPLEAANRSWMIHQMRQSGYFTNNHRLCVVVLLLSSLLLLSLLLLSICGISLNLCERCIVNDTFERILSPVKHIN